MLMTMFWYLPENKIIKNHADTEIITFLLPLSKYMQDNTNYIFGKYVFTSYKLLNCSNHIGVYIHMITVRSSKFRIRCSNILEVEKEFSHQFRRLFELSPLQMKFTILLFFNIIACPTIYKTLQYNFC